MFHRPSLSTRAVPQLRTRLLMSIMLILLGLSFLSPRLLARSVQAAPWSLTTAQRRAYVQYYAPVILKRGDENDGKAGRDWLTNYNFDQDNNFATNRVNWRTVNQYVAAAGSGSTAYAHWRIRPTLYTSLIEYMEGSSKSLVLLYHVYNAADKDASEIHDWERVEIVVRGVTGTPGGSGESVTHVTVTLHKEHHMRRSYDSALNFMQTATGKHVLLWQADESNWDINSPGSTHGHELRFVTNPYSWIASQSPSASAEVNITNKDEKKNVHYVFVPDGSSAAVNAWSAKPLSYATASGLASRVDNENTVDWLHVKRLTYELQDLADIFPTHWQSAAWSTHWLSSNSSDVLLESPILNEVGQAEVSTGLQRFYTQSRDNGKSDLTDGREGIPDKNWFYGAYSAELNPEVPSGSDDFQGYQGQGLDSYGRSRGVASGYANSHNAFWWQHDFFVHSGVINDVDTREEGLWLVGAWYTPANGGFDGRWVQLFDDRSGSGPTPTPQPTPQPSSAPTPTPTPPPTPPPPPASSYPSVSAGNRHACAVRTDQTVVCWGDNTDGKATPPSGSFTQVSAGRDHTTCGVRTTGTVVCWGDNTYGQATPPSGSFTQVSVGVNHTCGVRTTGTLVCWGDNTDGKATPPSGSFTHVSVGWSYTCALRTDQTVVCWNAGLVSGSFTQISVGDGHGCGVRTTGTLACWGDNSEGQATPPSGSFKEVSAGGGHTCGLRTDQTVACWGRNADGQATPPSGTFLMIDAGTLYTCGVRTDRTVACWGSSHYGRTRPPSGSF